VDGDSKAAATRNQIVMKPQLPKGTRDHLPAGMALRESVTATIKGVFERYGYEPLETPALELIDVLTGKYGEEADRLIFRILKRGEAGDRGEVDLGLRYDLTLPLARVIAMNRDLPLPFKRYQIQPCWRAEKPQRGRFREFIQCDVDCVGSASMLADAEIIAITCDCLAAVGFERFRVIINHRKILAGLEEYAGVPSELGPTAMQAIDKLEKVGLDGVRAELADRGVPGGAADKLLAVLEISGEPAQVLDEVEGFLMNSNVGLEGVAESRELLNYLETYGVEKAKYEFNLWMVRGLDYYTGPIYETYVDEPKVGSVSGGGRYDGLVGMLAGLDVPATGTTIGLERIITVLEETGRAVAAPSRVSVLVTVFEGNTLGESLAVARELRAVGVTCDVFMKPEAKLGKQLAYAEARGIPYVIIVGPEEVAAGAVQLKNMARREQRQVSRGKLVETLLSEHGS
jgi:histidyl-tRNA synthetase